MVSSKWSVLFFFLSVLSTAILSCGKKDKKIDVRETSQPVILKKDSSAAGSKISSPKNPPIINITDTIAPRLNIIYVKDSAATSIRLSQKLAQIYGVKLGMLIKQNKLKASGAPMAWYFTQKAPFFFEAGLPVDKKPGKLPQNIFYKTIGGDSALIAHFYGPYEQTSLAYEASADWLKSRKKKSKSAAYEIYVGDPIDKKGKPVDPYKVQTDIVFPHN